MLDCTMLECTSIIRNWLQILVAIWTLLWMYIAVRVYIFPRARLMRNLSKNLDREIAFVTPNNSSEYNMENERKTLVKSKVFKEPEYFSSYKNFSDVSKFSLVVIWYSKKVVTNKELQSLLHKIWDNTPIIIFTYWNISEIDFKSKDENGKIIENSTTHYLINNFPLKLLSDIFPIMSIYKSK